MSQLVKELNLIDTSTSQLFTMNDVGLNSFLTSNLNNANINLNPVGSVEFFNAIDLSGSIIGCNNIDSQNNNPLQITKTSGGINFNINNTSVYSIDANASVFNNIPTFNGSALDTNSKQIVNYNNFNTITTFDVVVTSSGGSGGVAGGKGFYLKVGNLIYFSLFMEVTSLGTWTGEIRINLPSSLSLVRNYIQNFTIGTYSGLNTAANVTLVTAFIQPNITTYFVIGYKTTAAAQSTSAIPFTAVTSSFKVSVSGIYYDY